MLNYAKIVCRTRKYYEKKANCIEFLYSVYRIMNVVRMFETWKYQSNTRHSIHFIAIMVTVANSSTQQQKEEGREMKKNKFIEVSLVVGARTMFMLMFDGDSIWIAILGSKSQYKATKNENTNIIFYVQHWWKSVTKCM